MSKKLPKYVNNKKNGNTAEALVQFVISKFCLVHKIDGSNDIGNDFICELIRDEYPTNLLFYVQVKFTSGNNYPSIKSETKNYWKSSPIPVYVFWVKEPKPPYSTYGYDDRWFEENVMYKPLTEILQGKVKETNYFAYNENEFKNQLILDYTRSQYIKGFAPVIEPRDFLNIDEKIDLGFPRYLLKVESIVTIYSNDILKRSWSTLFATAISLYSKGGKKNLYSAKQILTQAEFLYKRYGKHNNDNFLQDILKYKKLIEEKSNR